MKYTEWDFYSGAKQKPKVERCRELVDSSKVAQDSPPPLTPSYFWSFVLWVWKEELVAGGRLWMIFCFD